MSEVLSMDRLRDVDRVLTEALECTADELPAFLARACGDDAELRARVESSLGEESGARLPTGGALSPELVRAMTADLSRRETLPPGTVVGPYRIVRESGRGGMAVVYLAERVAGGFEQRVALKLIKRGLESEESVRRFLTERQILSTLGHPNIARLLDGGVTEDGRPFFAMEWVDGLPIDQYAKTQRLSVRARLRLITEVGRAVAVAHRGLVVHRDLKPSNILVTAEGVPKLLDFGIAKLLASDCGPDTRTADRLLTPAYASPEQIRGDPITTATDVYQLGVVLYELLTDCQPRTVNHARAQGRPDSPRAPSSVVPRALRRQLRGDVDTIVSTALHGSVADRYPSVERVVDDVERYLDGRPIRARRPSLGYQLRKLIWRHKLAAAATTLVVLLSIVYSVWLTRARFEASQAAVQAERTAVALERMFTDFDPYAARGGEITVQALLDRAAGGVDRDLADEPAIQARLRVVLAKLYHKLGDFDAAVTIGEQALAQQVALYGPGHIGVAQAALITGTSLSGVSRFRDARERLEQALAIFEGLATPSTDDLTEALGRLSRVSWVFGEHDRAMALSARALALAEQNFGPDDPRGAALLYDRGEALLAMGEPASAEPLVERAARLWRNADGPESARVGRALFLLGRAVAKGVEPAKAVPVFEQALTVTETVLGSHHPSTGDVMVEYGTLLGKLGQHESSLHLLRAGVNVHQSTYGPSSPELLRSLGQLAEQLGASGALAEAREVNATLLAVLEQMLGPESPHLFPTLSNLAKVDAALGDHDSALALYRRALAVLNASDAPDSARLEETLGAIEALAVR